MTENSFSHLFNYHDSASGLNPNPKTAQTIRNNQIIRFTGKKTVLEALWIQSTGDLTRPN